MHWSSVFFLASSQRVHAVGHQSDKVKTLRAVGAKRLIDDNARQIKCAADAGVLTILFGDLP